MPFQDGFLLRISVSVGLAVVSACSSGDDTGAPSPSPTPRADVETGGADGGMSNQADAESPDDRVDQIFGASSARFGDLNREQAERMIDVVEDGPFYMVNLIKHREKADYLDGRQTDLTGAEADALYAPVEFLDAIGAEIAFVAQVETNLPLGDGTQWDQIGIVRYPSRAKFLEMVQDDEFQARAIHKEAGVEKTIVMVAELLPSPLPEGYEPPEPTLPATSEDSAFDMVHLLSFHDVAQYASGSGEDERSGREAMDLYQTNAGTVAAPMGVYPRAWMRIEGVLIGDGREWDEFRINHFPSHATFQALTSDTTWAAGQHHRTAALADTYALQTLPVINAFEP